MILSSPPELSLYAGDASLASKIGDRQMYQDTETFVDRDFEQRVRQTAYHLWEDDGRPNGRETEYWFKAMGQLLAARAEADKETVVPSAKTKTDKTL